MRYPGDPKFKPWATKGHPRYLPLYDKWWFKAWNHWLNPFGNWHEPMPFPEKIDDLSPNNLFLKWLWWTWRNRFHNGMHFIFGITPRSDRYYWVSPTAAGWRREYPRDGYARWVKKFGSITVVLPYWTGIRWGREWGIGWKKRGSLGGMFRPYHAAGG